MLIGRTHSSGSVQDSHLIPFSPEISPAPKAPQNYSNYSDNPKKIIRLIRIIGLISLILLPPPQKKERDLLGRALYRVD